MSRQGDRPSEHTVSVLPVFRNTSAVLINPAPTQNEDRDDLSRLLGDTQSGSIEKKRAAAESLPRYIQKVPEMQDDVVNAVYDLCEDPSVEVSIIPPTCHLCVGQRFWVRFEPRGIKPLWRYRRKTRGY